MPNECFNTRRRRFSKNVPCKKHGKSGGKEKHRIFQNIVLASTETCRERISFPCRRASLQTNISSSSFIRSPSGELGRKLSSSRLFCPPQPMLLLSMFLNLPFPAPFRQSFSRSRAVDPVSVCLQVPMWEQFVDVSGDHSEDVTQPRPSPPCHLLAYCLHSCSCSNLLVCYPHWPVLASLISDEGSYVRTHPVWSTKHLKHDNWRNDCCKANNYCDCPVK